jgi:hypothetical protein
MRQGASKKLWRSWAHKKIALGVPKETSYSPAPTLKYFFGFFLDAKLCDLGFH